ncbi:hypothetical protein GCM10010289_21680 [Streptomyces violascens]|uniref:Uncharacterized protein n=1 Tax=Streptomyces violascens TaxID=67381 RepID=A0ABQ3QEM6_9ACTN|nr:hypothetical protein GCM10010289_21680 [Streptomyces violascens]GHI35704.1 hypothetical protein Sviol_01120 [Streptomyces violascens]
MSPLVAATSFTLAHWRPETKSGFRGAAGRGGPPFCVRTDSQPTASPTSTSAWIAKWLGTGPGGPSRELPPTPRCLGSPTHLREQPDPGAPSPRSRRRPRGAPQRTYPRRATSVSNVASGGQAKRSGV